MTLQRFKLDQRIYSARLKPGDLFKFDSTCLGYAVVRHECDDMVIQSLQTGNMWGCRHRIVTFMGRWIAGGATLIKDARLLADLSPFLPETIAEVREQS